ncbi:DUF1127 domain-containing protein [Mesorhizobium sp. BAC0120]|uniref:DUF1127 domain-containing protein n=1 Tax=Mesorhizobium sp. BAC0120 TaxID=3090670 RepID=UPI00399A06BE
MPSYRTVCGWPLLQPAPNSAGQCERRDTMSINEYPFAMIRRASKGRNLRSAVAQLFLRVQERWQRGRAVAALERLDDRLLEDIGIARSDIPQMVDGRFGQQEHGKEGSRATASLSTACQLRSAT